LGNKKLNNKLSFDAIILLVFVIITISPPLRVGMFYYISASILCMLWFLMIFHKCPEYFFRPSKINYLIMFNFIMITFLMLIFDNIEYWKLEIGIFLYYTYILFFNYYRKYNQDYLFKVFWFILTLLPFWSIKTLYALMSNPYAARHVREGNVDTSMNISGVGGYGHIYMSALIAICCFTVLLEVKQLRWVKKVLLLVNFILGISQVMISGYTLSAIIVIFGLSIVIVFKKNRYGKLNKLFLGTFSVFLILLFSNIKSILEYLLKISVGISHNIKIQDLIYFLSYREFGESFIARLDRYTQSLKSAVQYWYGGLITIPSINLSFDIYGWHSTILDGYAMYGIVLGTINVIILFSVPYSILRDKRYNLSSLPISIFCSLGILLLFNNATDAIAIAVTVVLYCSVEYLCLDKVHDL